MERGSWRFQLITERIVALRYLCSLLVCCFTDVKPLKDRNFDYPRIGS